MMWLFYWYYHLQMMILVAIIIKESLKFQGLCPRNPHQKRCPWTLQSPLTLNFFGEGRTDLMFHKSPSLWWTRYEKIWNHQKAKAHLQGTDNGVFILSPFPSISRIVCIFHTNNSKNWMKICRKNSSNLIPGINKIVEKNPMRKLFFWGVGVKWWNFGF